MMAGQNDTQLDRIEGLLSQVLDRLSRMEERQNAQSAQLESQRAQLTEHSQRLRDIELQHAVSVATTKQEGKRLLGRWGAMFSIFLVILGAIGSLISKAVLELIKGAS
ncbi:MULTISPECIES: hypothetical protein [unclassified Halomonas]|uniref:hypothetical protein n=1 Tax=unclassified Halomonas TaxID=2609666 RepID=UPI001EF565A2|nr:MULTISPECIES: hypothetical protein [unclassified Halomonas]MCP1342665.1 hypothetical protein [Halomonas sp. FL8]MCP1362567.1 hypothetical protein [Halomonas sp. BBD45]